LISLKQYDGAIVTSTAALARLPSLPLKTIKTAWGRRQQQARAAHAATAYIHRGIACFFIDDLAASLDDARTALTLAPTPRTKVAALTLLAQVTIKTGRIRDLIQVSTLLGRTARELPKRERLAHAQIRACRAIIAARFGALEEAERLLFRSLDTFRDLGAIGAYKQAITALVWVIDERGGRPDRARLVAQQLQQRAPPV
jgi:hypothetical protein